MRGKAGSSTVTYRLKLHYRNMEWLKQTKKLYNSVMLFYYKQLLEHIELLEFGNQKVMRELEKLTVTSRDKREAVNPIPYEKVPVYFRRAAINGAVGIVRTYHTKYLAFIEAESSIDKDEAGKEQYKKVEKPNIAEEFNAQPVFYKGMYKEFDGETIMLKLWTGDSWIWVKHKVSGRKLPEDAELMSPTVSINKNKAMLHVPVKTKVEDVRTVKERVEDGERICAVSLSSSDTLAVCTIFENDGHITDSCFIRGGDELKHRRKRLLKMIARRQKQSGGIKKGDRNNSTLYNKIGNITDYYSHLVSRKIIDFCKKHDVKIVVFQNIDVVIPYKDKKYIETNENDFIIQRIIKYVEYKAFLEGIVVTRVRPNYTSCKCHKCRSYVKRYDVKDKPGSDDDGRRGKQSLFGKHYICENGHQGNIYLNTSRNIGLMFLRKARVINSEVIKAEKSDIA